MSRTHINGGVDRIGTPLDWRTSMRQKQRPCNSLRSLPLRHVSAALWGGWLNGHSPQIYIMNKKHSSDLTVVAVVVIVVRPTSSNQLLGQTFRPISSNQLLANYFSIHSQHSEKDGRQGRIE